MQFSPRSLWVGQRVSSIGDIFFPRCFARMAWSVFYNLQLALGPRSKGVTKNTPRIQLSDLSNENHVPIHRSVSFQDCLFRCFFDCFRFHHTPRFQFELPDCVLKTFALLSKERPKRLNRNNQIMMKCRLRIRDIRD